MAILCYICMKKIYVGDEMREPYEWNGSVMNHSRCHVTKGDELADEKR